MKQFILFAVAGTVGFLVDIAVLYLMLACGLGYFAGRAISFIAAVVVTWQINRRFTFDAEAPGGLWREWWRYLVAMSAGGVVNYCAYTAVVLLLPKTHYLPVIAVAAGSICGLGVNFLSSKFWVFKQASASE
ncbi:MULTISPECIES: GtrA family protein [unclassified Caballeronia]|jgi:putative flippase GtrA|uniref:GtrA family protein n=1 Tax=unclassified Caballeronia TaxID=2646786 RepID=UPI002028AFA5|nr:MULTISPECIES: GtrA family protein [unclassified Caballeronia]MDR5765967.1 GtrA family protein [Caballeronia sp. LZ028]